VRAERALSNSSALCTSQVIKPPRRGGERHLLTRQTPGTGVVRVVRLVEMIPTGILSVGGGPADWADPNIRIIQNTHLPPGVLFYPG
jgi:hypothetical protein